MMHLVYVSDEGYLVPTLVSALSAVHHCSDKSQLTVHVVNCGIGDGVWQSWRSKFVECSGGLVKLEDHNIDPSSFSGLRQWRGSVGTYGRLLIPELLADADWCLYCDGDTLFTGDPLLLASYCDDRYALIGHRDRSWFQMNSYQHHGLELHKDEYVCAGVLLMNLRWARENGMGEKCLSFLRTYPRIKYLDQDALNNVCHGKIRQLNGMVFGCFSEDVGDNEQNPICIHYAGRLPPMMGYRVMTDIIKMWFDYANKLAGLGILDCGFGATAGKYRVKRFLFVVLKLVARTLPISAFNSIKRQTLKSATVGLLTQGL